MQSQQTSFPPSKLGKLTLTLANIEAEDYFISLQSFEREKGRLILMIIMVMMIIMIKDDNDDDDNENENNL